MTTRDIAKSLNTSVKVILTNAKKCMPNKIIRNGMATYWNKEESTLLIDYMKKNNNRKDTNAFTTVVKVTTDLTPALKIRQAMQLAQEGYEEELARIEAEKKVVTEERDNLKIELDESKQYITIKRMEAINPGKTFNWRQLKAESEKLNNPSKDVFDANYGTVKAYHVDVWESLFFDSINYPE